MVCFTCIGVSSTVDRREFETVLSVLHVSIRLYYPQAVPQLYFAKVTYFLHY